MVIFEDLQDHIINNKGLKKVALGYTFLGLFIGLKISRSAILGLDRAGFSLISLLVGAIENDGL